MTRVVNLRHSPYDVYIGRGGPFGNPFRIGPDGTREEVIQKYREWFRERIRTDDKFYRRCLALRGKVLGCFCKPLPCHGDVIVEWLEAGAPRDWNP